MPAQFEALRGFRDYLPADAAARSALFATVRRVLRIYGFEEVETPSVESLELFKVKSGEGIVDETFAFKDKGGREVTLVPEITPSVARVYVERSKIEPLPVKWFSVQRLWRYEEPQSGRTREFSQVNLDILGAPGTEAEVELLQATRRLMEEIGLSGRYVFRVNDRRLVEGIGRALGALDAAPFFRALDRREKLPPSEFQSELTAAGLDAAARDRLVGLLERTKGGLGPARAVQVLRELETWPGMDDTGRIGVANLVTLFQRVDQGPLADVVVFDPSMIRGLAYYTSTVFEAWARRGVARALFGGGRYDRLIELFGGTPTAACGLAIGDQTLELLLREAGRWPEASPGLQVYVATADASLASESAQWVERLRAEGLSADRDLLGRALTRQMKEAARRRARWLLLLGPREAAKGEVTIRNMRTGRQDVVASSSALPRLAKMEEDDPGAAAPVEGAPPPSGRSP